MDTYYLLILALRVAISFILTGLVCSLLVWLIGLDRLGLTSVQVIGVWILAGIVDSVRACLYPVRSQKG